MPKKRWWRKMIDHYTIYFIICIVYLRSIPERCGKTGHRYSGLATTTKFKLRNTKEWINHPCGRKLGRIWIASIELNYIKSLSILSYLYHIDRHDVAKNICIYIYHGNEINLAWSLNINLAGPMERSLVYKYIRTDW